ncbi:UvrABC system protein C [BD1-7 clade bacterium]|uniref:UvrABC system protein C n=1 Tax=BD1-7 clade bacterium TaxID=2029982 RepID=A0A5S9QUW2_9GAMM|nr:UvrABC system protein C [BD1-7 clade bacterium]
MAKKTPNTGSKDSQQTPAESSRVSDAAPAIYATNPPEKESAKSLATKVAGLASDAGEHPDGFDHKTYLKNLTQRPGVYQMHDTDGNVLYVGKAKNLKKRVGSYFRARGLNTKTVALVSRIHRIDVTVTATETEALLLEHNLIKQSRPPYNILLRDDKSYPYIFLSDAEYPRLSYHRGAKREKGTYFGPYPNASSVRESMNLLQQVFKVRQCEDSYFANRSRACLQYQIKRCSGPCMNHVSDEEYAEEVKHTRWFLEGRSDQLIKELGASMEAAAVDMAYEKAAEYRDQIQHLKRVTENQYIEAGNAEVDVVALAVKAGAACVHVLFVRGGRIIGSRSYYPKLGLDEDNNAVMMAFLGQFYLSGQSRDMPPKIVTNQECEDALEFAEGLTQIAGKRVQLLGPTRGNVEKWLQVATSTAEQNLTSRMANKQSLQKRFLSLQEALDLTDMPKRIECFDISHSSGEATVASCVVFDQNGPKKSDYRRFNIKGITGGDDYAAMQQALQRRFKKLVDGEGQQPDILLIDGGKGQVTQAKDVLSEYGLNEILIVGVAKGPTRKPGLEHLILADTGDELNLPADSPALHLIQHVRDESHRFAVKSHTQQRDKKRSQSALEGIPGVGPKRRRELLRYFGSMKAVTEAPVRELVKVPSVSEKIAEDIYAEFNKE